MIDGSGIARIAARTMKTVEHAVASGLVLEEELRLQHCGHFGGESITQLSEFSARLGGLLPHPADGAVGVADGTARPNISPK